MIFQLFIRVLLSGFLLTIASARATYAGNDFPLTVNCSVGSVPCGPAPSCCLAGHNCNYRHGIPICQNPAQNYVSGFDHDPCADPYLFKCADELGIPGFCCPIGTACFTEGNNNVIYCINAFGTTAPAIPSATTGLVPSTTPISGNSSSLVYSPSDAWNISDSEFSCSQSPSLHVTDTTNATISFNYTGPSIMVKAIASSDGGVFAVVVDGFNTTSQIDTYSGTGGLSLPLCYPLQFPPFVITPPGYQNQTSHTITLVYVGVSSSAPYGTNSSIGRFDSFALPDLQSLLSLTSNSGPVGIENCEIYLFLSLLAFPLLALI